MRKSLNFWDDDEMFCNHVRVVTLDAKRVDCSLLDISGGLVAKKKCCVWFFCSFEPELLLNLRRLADTVIEESHSNFI